MTWWTSGPPALWQVPGNGGAYYGQSLAALSYTILYPHTPLPSGSCTQHTLTYGDVCVLWGVVDETTYVVPFAALCSPPHLF